MKPIKVAVVGATGAVGVEMLGCLERSQLNIAELRLCASAQSLGQTMSFKGQELTLQATEAAAFAGVDLVLLAVSAELARDLAPVARAAGALVIDNSSAFRNDAATPLVVPELNGAELKGTSALIANPNCSTIVTLMAVGPLAQRFGLKSLIAATYQAVSGAGAAGLTALENELAQKPGGESPFTAPILNNLIPCVGTINASGETDEELKMRQESRKILNLPELQVACTCVRVATKRAHAIAATLEFASDPDLEGVIEVLKQAPGLEYVPDRAAAEGLNPLQAEGREEVLVGRVRKLGPGRFGLFVVGDQLLKGAALNAVQIAELHFG